MLTLLLVMEFIQQQKISSELEIKVVTKLNSTLAQGARKDEDKFDYNKDANRFVCPAEHMGNTKIKTGQKKCRNKSSRAPLF